MSRAFVAASEQYLEVDSSPLASHAPATLACWYNAPSFSGFMYLIYVADKDVADNAIGLGFSDNTVIALCYDSSPQRADATATSTADTWEHACGVFTSNVLRAAYLNGTNKGTDTADASPAGLDRVAIGRACDSTPTYYFGGSVAEAAAWDAALTDDEVAVLAAGYSPLFVRPQSLVFYMPLIRDNDNDLVGGLALTPVNSPTVGVHSPVVYPAPPLFSVPAAVAADAMPMAMHYYRMMRT